MPFFNAVIDGFVVASQGPVAINGKILVLNIIIGSFVVALGFFHRDLLIQKTSFNVILLVSAILFLLGIINTFFIINGFVTSFSSSLLLSPLITLVYFRLCRKIFLKLFSREPKDTFLKWSIKRLEVDIIFTILYFLPSLYLLGFGNLFDQWLLRMALLHGSK